MEKNSITDVSTRLVFDVLAPIIKENQDPYQINVNILPKISNTFHKREKEKLEEERFKTLIALSKVLDEETMFKSIKALGYKLEKDEKE